MRMLGISCVLCVAACAGPSAGPAPAPSAGPRAYAVVVTLPPGTLLRLPALEVVAANAMDDAVLTNGLWREAMRASARFDIAAGIEDTTSTRSLVAHLDPDTATLTTTLWEEGRPPTPLAAARLAPGDPAGALQALAQASRYALGETDLDPVQPLRLVYSAERACVLATERALQAAATGDLPAARSHLDDARRADAGCTVTILAHAELLLRGNDFARASRAAQDGLRLENRCSATTQHRLARVLLLARAALATGGETAQLDQQLLALGEGAVHARPHDPHGRWTQAQALSLLGRFGAAEAILAALRPRWPAVTQLPYHHALALLGCDRPDEALTALDQAQENLAPMQTAIPRAIALWSARRSADLTRFLADLAARADVQSTALLHHVRRMQAAQAILEERGDAAATLLLTDLEWLRQRTSRLGQYADHLASTGHVLMLLGHAAEVARAVDAFERLPQVDEAARRALMFVGGLAAVATAPNAAATAEASLSKEGASAWSLQLQAAACRERGELAEEARALVQAARLDTDPLLRASLARTLRTAGEAAQADQILTALRADLLRLDLRRLAAHPLLDPAHALALLATQ